MDSAMKAVALTRYLPIENPDSLLDVELPQPKPAGRDLLVQVKAISVNPVDTKVRRSKPDTVENEPSVLGWDAAGIVDSVGPEVTTFKPGDAVFYAGSVTRSGANSEHHLVDERIVGHKPASLDFVHAAALPLTSITAWEALFERLGIDTAGANRGSTLLIIGGAGGVGSIAIQLGKLAGLTVIATASRPETQAWVREMGADHVLDHRQPLPPQLEEAGFASVDYIANFSNTDAYWKTMSEIIRPLGKIVGIVENSDPIDLNLLKSKSATFAWEFMFTRSMFETPDMQVQHEILETISNLIDAGKIRSTHTETVSPINAANLRQVHAKLESGKGIGKTVLEGW